eukprot:CAMPEP_0202891530 /NCGR_PEP_ID=MMETSP1392-20130828/1570_1 /ASSEMBLY_ACC=CAM_ASM_000868 /TAXON_ID=225041 /ORGANISM="Chlamydomonas chlamydogama, Strain SAG 11-48b" /LENGTH=172 /DNA_ID=CAMNT_0049575311 /DNA_START=148 /DNA_END=666 /DNA_ORIENTATION=-
MLARATRVKFSKPSTAGNQFCAPHLQQRRVASANSHATKAFTAEDRINIVELCHRFDHAINNLDQPAAGILFHKDGVLHTPRGKMTGQQEIVNFFKSVEPMAKGKRHLTVNIVVDPESDVSARAHSYRLLAVANCPSTLAASGTIEDHLVKVDGKWWFAERRFVMDPPAVAN